MPIYTYNGATFLEEEVISKAEAKGLDLEAYINKFGIKKEEDKIAEAPGKPKSVAKKDAGATVKSTASKLVKPSSASSRVNLLKTSGVDDFASSLIKDDNKIKTGLGSSSIMWKSANKKAVAKKVIEQEQQAKKQLELNKTADYRTKVAKDEISFENPNTILKYDLENESQVETVAGLNKKLNRLGIEVSQNELGDNFNFKSISAAPNKFTSSEVNSVLGQDFDPKDQKGMNEYIAKIKDDNYISKAKQRISKTNPDYLLKITPPTLSPEEKTKQARVSMVSKFKDLEQSNRADTSSMGIGGSAGSSYTGITKQDFENPEDYNLYSAWKKTGILPELKEETVIAFDKNRKANFIDRASTEYARALPPTARKDLQIVTQEIVNENKHALKAFDQSINNYNVRTKDFENKFNAYKISPIKTPEEGKLLQEEFISLQTEQNSLNDRQKQLEQETGTANEVMLPAIESFGANYNRFSQLVTATKATVGNVGVALKDLSAYGSGILTGSTHEEVMKRDTSGFVYLASEMDKKQKEYQKSVGIDKIRNMSDAGNWLMGGIVNNVPSIGMAFTGPAAMPLFFASGYGGKSTQMAIEASDAKERLSANYYALENTDNPFEQAGLEQQIASDEELLSLPEYKKFAGKVIYGGAEVTFEVLGTLKILKGLGNATKMLPKKTLQEGLKWAGKTAIKNFKTEGLSELGTTITNNFSDIYILGENKNLFEGGLESFAQGGVMGVGFGGVETTKVIKRAVVSELAAKKQSRRIQDIAKQISEITGVSGYALNQGIPLTEQAPAVQKLVTELLGESEGIENDIINRLGIDLTIEQATQIGDINREIRSINKDFYEAAQDGSLEPAQLKALETHYRGKFNELVDQRETLLTDPTITAESKKANTDARFEFDLTQGYAMYNYTMQQTSRNQVMSNFNNLDTNTLEELSTVAKQELELETGKTDIPIENIKERAFENYAYSHYEKSIKNGIINAEAFAKNNGVDITIQQFEGADADNQIIKAYNSSEEAKENPKSKKAFANDIKNGSTEGANVIINGKQIALVHIKNSANNGRTGVGSHEVLHSAVKKAFIDQKAVDKAGADLLTYLEQYNPNLYALVTARIDSSYAERGKNELRLRDEKGDIIKNTDYYEEALNALSDLGSDGVELPTDSLNAVRNFINNILPKGFPKFKENEGADIYQFVKDYNKEAHFGKKQSSNLIKFGKKAFGGDQEEKQKSTFSKTVEERIEDLYDAWNSQEIGDKQFEDQLKVLEEEEANGPSVQVEPVKKEPVKKETTAKEPRSKGNLQNLLDTKYEGNQKRLASEGLRNTPSGGVTNDFSKSVIGKELGGTVETITRRLYDPIAADAKRNVTRDEYKDALIQSAALLINNEFDASKQTLDKFISSRLNLRANALAYELGIEGATKGGIKKDAAEEKGLMADETADQGFAEAVKEKPKYKNALEAKVFPTEVLETATKKIITITRTLKTRIDAPVSLNKTVTPLISEIRDEVGKQLDIDVKTMLGGKKDGVLKKELLRTKRYVLENMTTTWLMGKDGQGGIPMAIQKQIDGKWVNFPDWVGKKIDREKTTTDQAGRTSGAELVRRLPNVANNISDEVFLAQIIGPDGNPIRGRKESLSKAMSEEGAFDIINADFAEGGPIFEAFAANQTRQGYEIANNTVVDFARQSDRGNVKFSKTYNSFPQIKKDIFNSKINQLSAALNPYLTTSDKVAIKRIFKNVFIDDFSIEEIDGLVGDFRPWLKQMRDMYSKNVAQIEDTNFNEKGNFESFIKNVATMHEEGVLDVLDMEFSHESLFSPANVTDARTTTINMFSDWVDKFGRVEAAKMMIYSGGTFKSNASLGNLIGIQINPETKKVEFSGKKGRKSNQITESAEDYWDNIVYNSLPNGRSIANQLLVEEIKKATSIQRKKDSASKAYQDRDFEGRKAQSLEYRKIVQETFSYYFNPENEISDAAKAIMIVQMGSNMETAIRKSAILTNVYIPKAGIEAGALRYEHTRPASQVIAEILNAYKKGKGIATKEDLANIWDTYTAAVIPVSMDNNFNKAGFKSKMPPGWKKGMPTYYRYYNYATFGMKNMFAMESIDPANKEIIGEEFVKASDNAVNGIKNDTKIKAIVGSSKLSKTPKGISVFDFDDTVGLTSGSVLYTMPDGSTGKLNAEEFAKEGGNMLDAGAVFDFSEFSKVVDGKPGPMVEKMKKMIGKFGPENFFILTARPANAAGPIHEFLSSIGINIPLENITGLGNSTAQAKADWMTAKAAEGYNDFYFADDAIQNVEAVKKALGIPGVNSKIQQARAKFSLTSRQDLKWKQGDEDLSTKFTVSNIDYRISMIETAFMEYDDDVQKTLFDLVEENDLDEETTIAAYDGEAYNLEFWDKKQGNGITGTGNAAEVFGIVINGVTDRVKKKNIEALVFTAKEPSRIKLYNSMAEVVANKLGWGAYYKDGVYILSKKPKTIGSTTGVGSLKPVQDVLKVVDINSPINQSKAKFSKTISPEFNRIISRNTGIGPAISYSDIVAKRKGAGKNLFDLYVPASAADFELLLYNFIGKGSEGEAQKEFFADALLKPYANGNDLMDAARQSIKNNYKALIKAFPGIAKKLEKLTPDGNFTYDQALRVAMWNGSDVEIPGLSKRDTNELTSLVNNDTELYDFMSGLIVLGRQGNGWTKPGEYWDSSTIISDLHNLTEGEGRKQFLGEFIDNAEQMFGKWENGKLVGPNINKVEAIYGTDVREAIEDVLYRMSTGKNRAQGKDKITNAWFDWVSGSTGTIMFLNTRSAALQLIGAVNFLNLRDNNPIAAAKALANQPQYWKDFARIWNSDKMKERRGGLKEDVAAAEIANAAATSKNKPKAVVSYLLKIGYTPTQIADSFAIASGGAPFYRNRIKTYLKEGQTEVEAEKNAWNDFTKVSDETQQSGDPRDISKQQASGAGRLLLTFQNTAMQQSRIVKKSFLDLKNGRGDAKTHITKIAYYIAIQNLMFATLQQGLFAVLPGLGDDEEKEEDKKKRLKEKDKKIVEIANGVVDTVVRGTGLLGGVMVTLKNVIKKYMEERPKEYKADYTKVILEATNISPPIGSKLRKIYTGLQQTKFDKDLIKERGWGVMQDGRVHLGPLYSVAGKGVEATTNLPMDRLVTKVENISQALNSQNTAMQRTMIALGWTPRSVGVGDTAGDTAIETAGKAVRAEEGKIKGEETRERKKDSIRALPVEERIKIRREAVLKRRENIIKKRERMKKRKMG